MEIDLRGRLLRVQVNGTVTAQTDLDRFPDAVQNIPGMKNSTGRIGFQALRGTVRFRNIEIREQSMPKERRRKGDAGRSFFSLDRQEAC